MRYGCIKSELDGTEKVYKEGNSELPPEYSYENFLPSVLDQGEESICVPCSISSWINWKINLKDGVSRDNKVDLYRIYNIRHNKGVEGMQIKEALKFLKKEGDINGYAMIGSPESLKHALIANGPCIGGLPVCQMTTDDFWNGGDFFDGHAISVVGYNQGSFIIRNSWGKGYGNRGYVEMPYTDFMKFFELWTIV